MVVNVLFAFSLAPVLYPAEGKATHQEQENEQVEQLLSELRDPRLRDFPETPLYLRRRHSE